VLTGHYGSGKTELAINLAVKKRAAKRDTAIIDLDIANPYFRSRELHSMLGAMGIELISNAYDCDITADLPALSPMIGRYITDKRYDCIVDAGGNDSGARILNQYKTRLREAGAHIYIVVNVYRPETATAEKIAAMIASIERETGRRIKGVINNSNLLRATTAGHITDSMERVEAASAISGIPIVAQCCEEKHCDEITRCCTAVLPIKLHMRPRWLDA
jgi:Mrp family chromosome partitioning ATPase